VNLFTFTDPSYDRAASVRTRQGDSGHYVPTREGSSLPTNSPAARCTAMERCPRIERVADRLFEGEEAVLHVIERIVAPLSLRVDATSPWGDARLSDGSRVQTRFLGTLFRR
jgi:hypothetical protein